MARAGRLWLLALSLLLALALAACETDGDNGDDAAGDDPAADEPADEGDATDEEPADGDGTTEGDDADGAADRDLTPADGETIMDALREREADPDAMAEYEEALEEAAEDEEAEMPEEPAPSYDTLVDALEDAGLVELLDSEGPFTLFAPADTAFTLLPEESLRELLDDTERLERVLSFHIVEEEVRADDLSGGDSFETVAGETLTVRETEGGEITVDGVPLLDPDIEAGNGVIHGLSAVLLPPAE
jgi:uncharacterized surface protein with fasciclin (FAS1) repeats